MPEEHEPPVVAVVVASDSGPWLEECLVSLVEQDYASFTVLVVDAASTEPLAARVAAVAPGFFYVRLEENPGFGPAANRATQLVEGVSHFVFCHDDVVLARDAVRRMVEEAFRSNAGVVAPKLVDYYDSDVILQLGLGVDRFGAPVRRVERGELDQSQHDEPREVFAAPGGCTLVRADLFAAVGGFDPAISMFGEDVDLCWRARIAGARVMTAPQAVVRHLEATSARRRPLPEARALQWRHELRSVLKNYGRARRTVRIAQLAVLSTAEVVYFLALGRRSRAGQVVSAWRWNFSRRKELRVTRVAVASSRVVDDREIAANFSRRTFRVWRFVRPMLEDTLVRWSSQAARGEAGAHMRSRGHRERRQRAVTVVAVLVGIVVVFGSRSLLFGGLPLIGRYLPMPSPTHLLATFLGGTTNAGMQRPGPASPGLALLGLGGYVAFGGMGLLAKIGLIAAIALGALGVARFIRPFGSPIARLGAAVVYLFLPLCWDDIARGDVSGIVCYSVMPFVLARLGRATGLMPDPVGVGEAPAHAHGALGEEALGLGVLLAFAGAFAPIAILITAVAAGALLVGSAIAAESRSGFRAVAVGWGGCLVAIVVLMPWSITFFQSHASLSILEGALPSSANVATLAQLLRLDVGPIGNSLLDWAFLAGAVFVLLIAHDVRLDWAVRLWFVALGTAAFAWVNEEGWAGVGGGLVRSMLAPFGVCVALLIGLVIASLEEDLAARHFGWRHVAAVAFAIVTVAGVIPVLGASFGGRWGTPSDGYDTVLSFLDQPGTTGPGDRTLFLGEPRTLPIQAWELAPGLALGVSQGGLPMIDALYSSSSPGVATDIERDVIAAEHGETVRLGAALAAQGIRYVVVPTTLAPVLTGTQSAPSAPPPEVVLAALAAQQDLRELPPADGVLVFENTAWHPGVAAPAPIAAPGGTPAVVRSVGVGLELAGVAGLCVYYIERRRRRSRRRTRRHESGRAFHPVAEIESEPELALR